MSEVGASFGTPSTTKVDLLSSTVLSISTAGEGFVDLTASIQAFVDQTGIGDGLLTLFCRHTSASLMIQENADPSVRTDLTKALRRLAPANAGWSHDIEGPDDMPAHIRTLLTATSLQVPVLNTRLALGTWQAIYLIEHRHRPHQREIVLQVIGNRR